MRRAGSAPLRALDAGELAGAFADSDAMPASVVRLCALVSDPHAEMSEIVAVIEHDQVLTGHLLRRANSAASSALEPVRTVRDAAVRLGPPEVLSVALAASVSGVLRRSQPAYALDEGDLWRRSVAASAAAEIIRERAARPLPREVGTTALLHDIGKVVIGRALPLEHVRELRRVHQEAMATAAAAEGPADTTAGSSRSAAGLACLHDEAMLRAERDVLGVDHAEVGQLVAIGWGLPPSMTDAIAQHHQRHVEGRGPNGLSAALAHAMVVDVLAPPGDEQPSPVPAAFGPVLLALGLDPEAYAGLRDRAAQRCQQVTRSYEV